MTTTQTADSDDFLPALWLGGAMIVFAAVFRGGNRWAPLLALTFMGLALLVSLSWSRSGTRAVAHGSMQRKLALWLVMSSPFWVAVLQLIPFVNGGGTSDSRPLSLLPDSTWYAALAAIPVVASMALALWVSQRRLSLLLKLWIATATLQAIVGLLQLVEPALYFGDKQLDYAKGTFGSRNSFGNYLAMVLPLTLLLAMGTAQGGATRQRSAVSGARWLWRAVLLLLLAGLMASMSRGGIATGLLVLLLGWLLIPDDAGRNHGHSPAQLWQRWWSRLLLLGMLVFVMASGGWDWLARFETGDAARLLNWASSWSAAQALWPMGSGLGTFGAVFPAYQPPELGRWFVNFAHNEYLQLLMECGALVIPVALALVWLIARRAVRLVAARRRGTWSEADSLALACGLGFLAQALHAWVDYPWRIPATAMLGAFLLGVYLREPTESQRQAYFPRS